MNKIDKFRIEKNITQKDLTLRIGKSREWYSQAMTKNNLMVSDLKLICDVLGIDPCDILETEQRKKEAKKENAEQIQYFKNQIELQQDLINALKTLLQNQQKKK